MNAQTAPHIVAVGKFVGRAIAQQVLADQMPRQWTGIDPQDGDQFVAAGLTPGTPDWAEAEEVAEASYYLALIAA